MTITIKYFAWLRERLGREAEDISLPPNVTTLAELIAHLKGKVEDYAYAFESEGVIRAALDKRHAPLSTAIGTAREVAFFPPMTGG